MKKYFNLRKINLKSFGFTLIEVLATIILIGLVMVIVIPKINKTINNSQNSSYKISVNRLINGLNSYAIEKKALLVSFNGCYYDFDYSETDCEDFTFSGKRPSGGSVSVDTDGNVNGYLIFDNNEVRYNVINNKIVEEE